MTHVRPAESIDYLTRLPAELFQHILEFVDQSSYKRVYLGLVSKAFLPFARSRIFPKIVICGSARLAKLVDTIEGSRGVGAYVKEPSLTFDTYRPDDGTPSSRAVLILLTRLPKLEQLKIKGSTRLGKAVIADTRTPRLFPSLFRLSLDDPFDGWPQPFDPAHFSNLGRHSRLHLLDLTVPRSSQSFGRYRSSKDVKVNKVPWCWGMTLKGALCGSPAALDLVRSFSQINQLYLREQESQYVDDLPALLAAVRHPWCIKGLSLNVPRRLRTYDKLAETLSTCANLEVLQFVGGSFDTSLLPSIRTVKWLEELYLHVPSNLSATDVKTLFEPPDLPRLRIISIATLSIGWNNVPRWTSAFSQVDMEEILALAEARNIEVQGYASDWTTREKQARERKQAEGRPKISG